MKIALCLSGYFDTLSVNALESGVRGYGHLFKTLFSKYLVDVFIHCWQPEKLEILSTLYNPVCIEVDDQVDFHEIACRHGISQAYFDEGFDRESSGYQRCTIFNSLSFFYSRWRSIFLKRQHECDNGFLYDWVIVARLDIGQRGGWEVRNLYFDSQLDRSRVYFALYPQLNAGMPDMWFYGASSHIDSISTIYEMSLKYLLPESEYVEMAVSGWPDSKLFDINKPEDPSQYTNEVLLPCEIKSKCLMQYPLWYCINNHMLYKYHLLKVGLYDKVSYVCVQQAYDLALDDKTLVPECTLVMYTHSDYSDVWPVFWGQYRKHMSFSCEISLFINSDADQKSLNAIEAQNAKTNYPMYFYDSAEPYPKRLLLGLKNISHPYCILHHEDMFLLDDVDSDFLFYLFRVLGQSTKSFIRLISTDMDLRDGAQVFPHLYDINGASEWIFSIQPSIWKTEDLIRVCELSRSNTIWEFEIEAQKLCRDNNIFGFAVYTGESKRGSHHFDSKVYPYIATAVVKGLWNYSEYGQELIQIIDEYKINACNRGFLF